MLAQTSLDDAVALLKREDRASGFHHNLGICGEQKLLSVEAPASGCVVEEVCAHPKAHTNHLVHNRFVHIKQERAASSLDRLRRAEALMGECVSGGCDPLSRYFKTRTETAYPSIAKDDIQVIRGTRSQA